MDLWQPGVAMTMLRELRFHSDGEGRLALPARCTLDVSCFEETEVQEAVAIAIEETLYIVALAGIEMQALDGVTVAPDCRAAACALQNLPEGQVPLEMNAQPEVMEVARTAAVRREGDLRFHIVLRPGLALMTLSPEAEMQRLAEACIAHEAAHVQHESHLYRMFPETRRMADGILGGSLDGFLRRAKIYYMSVQATDAQTEDDVRKLRLHPKLPPP
jgi:hypothetical protein